MRKTFFSLVSLVSLSLMSVIVFSSCTPLKPVITSPIPLTVPKDPSSEPDIQASRPKFSADNVTRLTVDQLKQKIDAGSKALIVDVRSKEEYDFNHLPGAISTPLLDITTGNWYPALGQETIIYCS
jgi:hypothetical protein